VLPDYTPPVILFLAACNAPNPELATESVPWNPPDEAGPWPVGVRTVVIDDPRGGELTLEVWYPADPEPGSVPTAYDIPLLQLVMDAIRDAPPAGADHPLVVFSHGYGGSRHQSVYLTEGLASHGFVVVGVDHPYNSLFDLDEERTGEVALRRPVDLRIVADWALGQPDFLAGRVRDAPIGVLGHSFGAWTSLVSGGGRLDVPAALGHCATDPTAGCGFIDGLDIDGDIPDPDPRVGVTMALAPGGWYSFGDGGLDDVGPALVVGGRDDEDLPYDDEIRPTFEAIGGEREMLTIERAGHWGFTDFCLMVPVVDCAGEAQGWVEPQLVQDWSLTAVVAFAGVHLHGDDRYAPWLQPDAWTEPDQLWEGLTGR
jgi:predicted dienelactone hydrolase